MLRTESLAGLLTHGDVFDQHRGTRHETSDLVRWMTSFATTPDDVERFVAGVQSALDEA